MSLVCNYCGSDDINLQPSNLEHIDESYWCNQCQDFCQPVLEGDYLQQAFGECCGGC